MTKETFYIQRLHNPVILIDITKVVPKIFLPTHEKVKNRPYRRPRSIVDALPNRIGCLGCASVYRINQPVSQPTYVPISTYLLLPTY